MKLNRLDFKAFALISFTKCARRPVNEKLHTSGNSFQTNSSSFNLNAGIFVPNPNAGIFGFNTNAGPSRINPNAAQFVGNPNAGIFGFSTNAAPSRINPNAAQFVGNPNAGIFVPNPNAGPSKINTNAAQSSFNPNAGIFVPNPNAGPSKINTNAAQSKINTNAAQSKINTNAGIFVPNPNANSVSSKTYISLAEDFNNIINETSNSLAQKLISSGISDLNQDEFSKEFTERCEKLTTGRSFYIFILIKWFNAIKDNTNDKEPIQAAPKSSKLDNSHLIDLKEFLPICTEFLDAFKNEKIKIALANCFMESNYLLSQLKGKFVAFFKHGNSYNNILLLQSILSDDIINKFFFDFSPSKLSPEDSFKWLLGSFFFSPTQDKNNSFCILANPIAMTFSLIIEQSEEQGLIEAVNTFLSRFPIFLKNTPSSVLDINYNGYVKSFTKLLLSFIEHLRGNVYSSLLKEIESFKNSYDLNTEDLPNMQHSDYLIYSNEVKRVLIFIDEEKKGFQNINYEPFQIFLNENFLNSFDYKDFQKIMHKLLKKIEGENTFSIFIQQNIKNEQYSLLSITGINFEKLLFYFSYDSLRFNIKHFLKFLNDEEKINNSDILDFVQERLSLKFYLLPGSHGKFLYLEKYLSAIK